MIFDTLKFARALRSEFSQEQAETLASAIAEGARETLATKADIAAEIAHLKVDLVRWIVTAIAFNLVATAGFIITALKLFK